MERRSLPVEFILVGFGRKQLSG